MSRNSINYSDFFTVRNICPGEGAIVTASPGRQKSLATPEAQNTRDTRCVWQGQFKSKVEFTLHNLTTKRIFPELYLL